MERIYDWNCCRAGIAGVRNPGAEKGWVRGGDRPETKVGELCGSLALDGSKNNHI